jgi:hypothetical protein
MVFGTFLPGENTPGFLFLKPSPLGDATIAQAFLKEEFFQKLEHTSPPEPRYLFAGELKGPGQHRPIMLRQGKS